MLRGANLTLEIPEFHLATAPFANSRYINRVRARKLANGTAIGRDYRTSDSDKRARSVDPRDEIIRRV